MAIDLNDLATALGQLVLRFRLRRRTAAEWTAANEVILSAEQGYETDTKKMKIGDGITAWNSLAYWSTDSGGGGGSGTIVTVAYGDYGSLDSGDAGSLVFQQLPISEAVQMVANPTYYAGYTLDETTGNFADSGPNGFDATPESGVTRGNSPISPISSGHSAQAGASAGIATRSGGTISSSVVATMLLRLPATTNLYGEFFKLGVSGGFSLGFNNGVSGSTSFAPANAGRVLGIGQNGVSFRSQIYNFGSAAQSIRVTVAWMASLVRVYINNVLVFTTSSWGSIIPADGRIQIGYGEGTDITQGVDIDDVVLFSGSITDATLNAVIGYPTNSPVGVWNGTAFDQLA